MWIGSLARLTNYCYYWLTNFTTSRFQTSASKYENRMKKQTTRNRLVTCATQRFISKHEIYNLLIYNMHTWNILMLFFPLNILWKNIKSKFSNDHQWDNVTVKNGQRNGKGASIWGAPRQYSGVLVLMVEWRD